MSLDPLSLFKDVETLCESNSPLAPLGDCLSTWLPQHFHDRRFGDLARWLNCLEQLPGLQPSTTALDSDTITIGKAQDASAQHILDLEQALRGLHPWRKGPFDFFGIHIDTEWRSDWKWNRLKNHIDPLQGKTVLDVGCGSGYHCWRMRGAGAHTVIGIDPGPLFVLQFHAAQTYLRDKHTQVLPLRMEDLPGNLQAFDSVFSMGLLYHRRSPMDHLLELKDALKPGGQLILETLVIDGRLGDTLMPEGRYAKMGNVWFLPSPLTLESWLRKTGLVDIHCVDITTTSIEEQHATDWMRFQSLKDFLDPTDSRRTIEGYPAPCRGIFVGRKPC